MINGEKKLNIAIVGSTGYTARELILILLNHPNVKLVRLCSRNPDSIPISETHPILNGRLDLNQTPFDINDLVAAKIDVAFCCLPHAASAKVIKELLANGIRVVDFSADYRLNDRETFESWYNVEHPDPDRCGNVPYGLPELFRAQIKNSLLIANPGCFPTSAILPLAPLLKTNQIETNGIIIDSKTGVSGAGRTPQLPFHYPECNESISAYSVGVHRHQPEIENILERFTGLEIDIVFTPHLVPMERGILSTIYCHPAKGQTSESIFSTLSQFYESKPFVRVVQQLPSTKNVSGTNYCNIAVRQSKDTIILLCAIDNLVKGASGAAVQNFNIMCGFDEETALRR